MKLGVGILAAGVLVGVAYGADPAGLTRNDFQYVRYY